MYVISHKTLVQFWQTHPDSEIALERWYKLMKKNEFASLTDLRAVLPSVDLVGNLIVFNIGGNDYRLIATVHFYRGKVFVRHVFTHRDYDEGRWKK